MTLDGKILGGCEIIELVGRGGMGEVYRAIQLSLDREVAIKVLGKNYANNPEFHQRFLREARSIAKVNHSNILQIFEVGEFEGSPFMVMEFIRGCSLAERLKEKGFIPWREASGFVLQAASGLANAARNNIIHRDIKPDNLMVTEEGLVKVSDFGLAKECHSGELTQTDSIMGTPAYMSPEQCDGRPDLDSRSDMYSLGGTFFRLVTGVLPFDAPTPMAMMYKHKHEELVSPSKYMPGIPARLCEIITRMMAKEKEDRFSTMQDLVVEIQSVLSAPADEPVGEMTLKISPGGESDFEFGQLPPKRRDSSGNVLSVLQREEDLAHQLEHLLSAGDTLQKQNRPVAAYAYWRKALELSPNDQAIQRRMVDVREDSTVASIQIASRLIEQGRIGEQRRELQQLLKVDPDNVDAMERLQALDLIDSRKRTALNELRKMLAAREYEKALERWISLPELLRDKSLIAMMENIEHKVLPVQRLCLRARELARQGLYLESMTVWEEAKGIDGTNDHVLAGLQEIQRSLQMLDRMMRDGYECEVQGRFEQALDSYERILKIIPAHPQAIEKTIFCLGESAGAYERSGDYAKSLAKLERLIEIDPSREDVKERAEVLRHRLGEVYARTEKARTAMKRGRYTVAIREWAQVEQLQPGSSTAIVGKRTAKKSRFYRRVLPVSASILLVFVVIGTLLKLQHNSLSALAQNQFTNQQYDAAILSWIKSMEVPVWGRIQKQVSLVGIAKSTLLKEKVNVSELRRKRSLDHSPESLVAFFSVSDSFRKQLAASNVFAIEQLRLWEMESLLDDARLAFDLSRIDDALLHYGKAREFGRLHTIVLPMKDQMIVEGLNAFRDGQSLEKERRTVEAIASYRLAVEKITDFSQAREKLEALESGEVKITDHLKQARQFLISGSSTANGKLALSKFYSAQEKARAVLALDPRNLAARRIEAEANWRIDAGPDMVFFMLTPDSALAVDRYEYPNQKDVIPQSLSYIDARKAAGAKGKQLPTLAQWRIFSSGADKKRIYAWGEGFDASRCTSSVGRERLEVAPAGSVLAGATPEGLFDIAGNLAEWVDTGVAGAEGHAVAMGGHFASTRPEQLTTESQEEYPTAIANRYVGFRCVKVYHFKE